MKKFTNQLTLFVVLCVAVFVIQSCNSSDNDERYMIYATVKYLEGTDNQKDLILYSESNKVEFFIEKGTYGDQLKEGQRVIADVTVLSGDLSVEKKCTARLNQLKLVDTKDVEVLAKGEEDKFGLDRVGLYVGTTGLDGYYLNVVYTKYGDKSEIALVKNETKEYDEDSYLHLELRYDAKGAPFFNTNPTRVSFNLNSIPNIDFSQYNGIKVHRINIENKEDVQTFNFPKKTLSEFAHSKLTDNII